METINSTQLSFLLQIDKKNALEMIAYCLGKDFEEMKELSEEKFLEVDITTFEKKKNIPLRFAIENIQKKALVSAPFKGYLIQYPLKKLKPNKMGFLPRSVRLPPALRSLMLDSQRKELSKIWSERYERFNYKDKDLTKEKILDIKFNP